MQYKPSDSLLIKKERAGGLLIGCGAGIGYEEMVDSAQRGFSLLYLEGRARVCGSVHVCVGVRMCMYV